MVQCQWFKSVSIVHSRQLATCQMVIALSTKAGRTFESEGQEIWMLL